MYTLKISPRKMLTLLAVSLLLILLAAGCNSEPAQTQEEPQAESLEMPVEQPTVLPATEAAPETIPAQEVCNEMETYLIQNIGLPTNMYADVFDDQASGLFGSGCTVTAGGTGDIVAQWGNNNNNLIGVIQSAGWVEDIQFSGGGATGIISTYRKNGYVCRYLSEVQPTDMSLCPGDQPITTCMDNLAPHQKQYQVTFSCSIDSYVPQTNTQEQIEEPTRIDFAVDQESWYTPGSLSPNQYIQFIMWADAGQEISFYLNSEPANGASISIWGADGWTALDNASNYPSWSGTIPTSQDYFIQINNLSQQEVGYTFSMERPQRYDYNAQVQNSSDPIRIQFNAGTSSWYTPGDMTAMGGSRFVLWAEAGQQMNINLSSEPANSAILVIWGDNGTMLLSDSAHGSSWFGDLPASQDYYIDVRNMTEQYVTYALNIEIPPLEEVTQFDYDPGEPERIEFDSGSTSMYKSGTIAANQAAGYVLYANQNQIMSVSVSSDPSESTYLIIEGADGTNFIYDADNYTWWNGQLPSSQDYYITLTNHLGQQVSYDLLVEIE